MGSYSSESDSSRHRHHGHSRKHKKRRSRSRSYSSDESRSRRKHKKSSKKSKHRRRSRSHSRSSDKSYRRRSRGRGSRSRSRSPYSSKRRRSRSRSRSRRSPKSRRRSGSRQRSRRSNSRSERSRKRSSVTRRRSSSPDSTSRASSINVKVEKGASTKVDPCADIPGFEHLPPAKQAELRLQMALKAAAVADQKLQDQGLLPSGDKRGGPGTPSMEEQQKRAQDIDDIERDEFEPAMFRSSRNQGGGAKTVDTSHSDAMFGGGGVSIIPTPISTGKSILSNVDSLFGPVFAVSPEEKMERWKKKLMSMRRKKLEGEAMS